MLMILTAVLSGTIITTSALGVSSLFVRPR